MRTMLKALSLTIALSARSGLTVAKELVKNVSKERHPNLAAAQKARRPGIRNARSGPRRPTNTTWKATRKAPRIC